MNNDDKSTEVLNDSLKFACAMCGKWLNDAFSNYPTILFCSPACKDKWLKNAVAEDIRVLLLDGDRFDNTMYSARQINTKRIMGYRYFKSEVLIR